MRTRHVSANIKQTMRQALGTADIREIGALFKTRSGSVGWQELSTDDYQTALRNQAPRLETFKPVIDAMLRQDLEAPPKQRHTARRVFARLADEHGARQLSYSTVGDYVRKRRPEVLHISDILYPKAGYFRQPLNPSDSNYQGTSHSSSGESTGTQIPAFKTVPG